MRTSSGDVGGLPRDRRAGYDHTPDIPAWPGRESYRGRLLHAAEYKEPSRTRAGDVLVVGPGCSGMEIAYDLATSGARRVRLAVRTPPNILLRSPVGPLLARLAMHTSPERADAVMAVVRRRMIGDLSEYGLPVPAEGIFSRLTGCASHRRSSTSRRSTRSATGASRSSARSRPWTSSRPPGRRQPAGAGRGDRRDGLPTGLEPLAGHLGVLDERGVPLELHGEAAPGLRFIGYLPRPAHIGLMGQDARRAAAEIAAAWPAERGSTGAAAAGPRPPACADGRGSSRRPGGSGSGRRHS